MNNAWLLRIMGIVILMIFAAVILIGLLVLIRLLFGDSLKRLWIQVSPRGGVGVSIETHLRQLAVMQPASNSISPAQMTAAVEMSTEEHSADNFGQRVVDACRRFGGQRVPISLFGYHYYGSDASKPGYIRGVFDKKEVDGKYVRSYERFLLSRFDFIGLIPETLGVRARIYTESASATGHTFGFSGKPGLYADFDFLLGVSWLKMRRMLVVYEQTVPQAIRRQWLNEIVTLKKSLNKETVLWVIIMNDADYDRVHGELTESENLVLVTSKSNFEALESILKISHITPGTL